MITIRERKSKFVKLFDKTPENVTCPHFFELVLSNGCPFNCSYCYLRLTFKGRVNPVLFNNEWKQIKAELDTIPKGVFVTGELADSLAITPPLLEDTLNYFEVQKDKYLILLTKSVKIDLLTKRNPNNQIVVSFSVNSVPAFQKHEKGTPHPIKRLAAAKELKDLGWRIRIRIDPIIIDTGLEHYKDICKEVAKLKPEMVTVGTLRQYPGLYHFSPFAPREGLVKSEDGRMRYPLAERGKIYNKIKNWLGQQPTLCKETTELWKALNWEFKGCNCTV